jgi:hypothetical protein
VAQATLADELVLLAYRGDTGRSTVSQIALDLGLAAAILLELVLRGRITVDGGVLVADPADTGEPVLDEMLSRIRADVPRSAASWVQRLRHNLRELVLSGLVQRGVVRDQPEAALDHIPLHRYPTVDSTLQQRARARLLDVIVRRAVPDERTAALATLVAHVRMTPTLGLTGGAVADAHRRLEEVAAGFTGEENVAVALDPAVRPSVAVVVDALNRAVSAALGPATMRPSG